MIKTILLSAVFFVVFMAAAVGIATVVEFFNEEPPLLLAPEDVAGAWPFPGETVQVSCCTQGRVSLVIENGQHYYFAGTRHADRFPVAALARPDARDGDFEAVHAAARRLARTRWPDLVR